MKKLGYFLIFISVAFVVYNWLGEFMVIDMCLDAGKVYDYATSTCRSDIHTSEYIPYTTRFVWELMFSLFGVVVGVTLIAFSKKKSLNW